MTEERREQLSRTLWRASVLLQRAAHYCQDPQEALALRVTERQIRRLAQGVDEKRGEQG